MTSLASLARARGDAHMSSRQASQLTSISILILLTLNCGGYSSNMTVTPPPKPEFLYTFAIGNPGNPTFQLSTAKLDPSTGALTISSTVPLSQLAPGIAVQPNAEFLYLSYPNPGADAIGIFSIDPNTGIPSADGGYLLTVICPFCLPRVVLGPWRALHSR